MQQTTEPLISIIVPVYNDAPFLHRCVDSILNQTYNSLEILLIDDGSVDGSGEICDEYAAEDKKIKVIHKANGGTVSARKCGLGCARGQLVSFIDGDDWIEADTYEKLIGFYIQEKYPDIVSFGMFFEQLDRKCETWLDGVAKGRYEKGDIERRILPALIYDPVACHNSVLTSVCTKLIVRPVAMDAMQYMADALTLGEDGAFVYFLVSCCTSMAILHKAFYHYEQHNNSQNYKLDAGALPKLEQLKQVMKAGMDKLGLWNNSQIQGQVNYYIWCYLNKIIMQNFHFDANSYMYMFPFSRCERGCRVLVYGAGKVGRSYIRYLGQSGYAGDIMWTDRNFKELQEKGMNVLPVGDALQKDYDYIVIAVDDKKTADAITGKLLEQGVKKEKIVWEKPIRIGYVFQDMEG